MGLVLECLQSQPAEANVLPGLDAPPGEKAPPGLEVERGQHPAPTEVTGDPGVDAGMDAGGANERDKKFERQLLLSMGWDGAEDEDNEEEGGLEPWEIEAAQASFREKMAQRQPEEGSLQERAQRQFNTWAEKQSALDDHVQLEHASTVLAASGLRPPPGL